jgi:hypothetical protein
MAACPRCGSRSIRLVINPLTWPAHVVTELRSSRCPRCGWRGWKHKSEWIHIRHAGVFAGGTGHTGKQRDEHSRIGSRRTAREAPDRSLPVSPPLAGESADPSTPGSTPALPPDTQAGSDAAPVPSDGPPSGHGSSCEPDLEDIDRRLAEEDERRAQARRARADHESIGPHVPAHAADAATATGAHTGDAPSHDTAGESSHPGTHRSATHRSSRSSSRRFRSARTRERQRRARQRQVLLVIAAIMLLVLTIGVKQACFPSAPPDDVGTVQ